MPKDEAKNCEISIDEILTPREVIHPCLDWVKGQLIVGVDLKGGKTAVLSSTRGLVRPEELGAICKQGEKFNGAVSRSVADKFVKYLKALREGRESANDKKLLTDLATYQKRFVVFPQAWFPHMLARWIQGTYLFPMFQTYPYLRITSATPGCGKSLLGEIIAKLSFHGEFMVAPTEAQLFHLPEVSRGVQVWDEVECGEDSEKKRFSAILPVLLNGYRNGGAVPRQTGKNFERSTRYHVFCPRVFIGLTKLPEPALQRTIQVRLEKRTREQKVEHYIGSKHTEEECDLKERCLLWALKMADSVNGFYQSDDLRRELETLVGPGRSSDDIWLPIFAVASAAKAGGRDSLETLKTAAKQLAGVNKKSFEKPPVPMSAPAPAEDPQESSMLARVALGLLEFSGPLTPEELAQRVSNVHGRKVTAQKLSKSLSKIRVRAKKENGRRVFVFDAEAAVTSRNLGFSTAGQQGQEDSSKREVEVRL